MLEGLMVRSRLKEIIAQRNLDRIRRQEPELTIRQIALESGVPSSVVTGLTTNRAVGVQFKTLNRLCVYLNCSVGDILVHEPDEEK